MSQDQDQDQHRRIAPSLPNVLRGIADEMHKPARRNYTHRHTTVKGFRDLFQADLIEMQAFENENNHNRYMLTVIDVFSKYAWARPIRRKTSKNVVEAMRDILNSTDGARFKPPKYLQTDQGTEFYNTEFQDMLREYDIKLFSVFSNVKASVVERFNRTLKSIMWKEFSAKASYRWVDILPELMVRYNSQTHRTIGMAPVNVQLEDEEAILSKHQANHAQRARGRVKFRVGDYVRLSKIKGVFQKGYTPNWSSELFIINQVLPTAPVTYELKDVRGNIIKGCVYNEEIQPTNFKDIYLVDKIVRRRNNRVLVKWYGFPDSENTWENADDIIR